MQAFYNSLLQSNSVSNPDGLRGQPSLCPLVALFVRVDARYRDSKWHDIEEDGL